MRRIIAFFVAHASVAAIAFTSGPQIGCVGDLMCGETCNLPSTECGWYGGSNSPFPMLAEPKCPTERGCELRPSCVCADPYCTPTQAGTCVAVGSEGECTAQAGCTWGRRCAGSLPYNTCDHDDEDDCRRDSLCRWERHCN